MTRFDVPVESADGKRGDGVRVTCDTPEEAVERALAVAPKGWVAGTPVEVQDELTGADVPGLDLDDPDSPSTIEPSS